MSAPSNFAWGRWIRASIAHHYLGVDRNWFMKHVRPFVPVIKLSTQARAYRKSDLDARAEQIEITLLQPIDDYAGRSEHNVGNGRPIVGKGGNKAWGEREPARVTFREAARKYLRDEAPKLASSENLAWHVGLLDPFVGDLALEEVHDETLRPFKEHRLKRDGVGVTTVNRSFEVVRRICA